MNGGLMLLAEGATRTRFEWGRIQSNGDWVLPLGICLAIMLFVRYLYHRDAKELPTGVGWLLTALRTAVFYGLLILYLQPQWRTEREVTRNSRVLLLADTSQSMRLTDVGGDKPLSRAEHLASRLGSSGFIERLRQTHDVLALRFDREIGRIALLARQGSTTDAAAAGSAAPPNWREALAAAGVETRLGESLRQLLHNEQNAPLAGVVIATDGGQNAGTNVEPALQAARELKLPIFAIGLGSDRQPANVRVSNLAAPPRAYPGDRFVVTAFLQGQKVAGQSVKVELLGRPIDRGGAKPAGPGQVQASKQVTLGGDGEVVPVGFELSSEEAGGRTLTARVQPVGEDHNPDDNQREVDVEIVDRRNRVMLLAGGPSREYQFLRSVLFRDKSVELDVLLQTAQPGISQDAKQILDDFPLRREDLFAYDCIVALDPDWQALSAEQIALLEKWVGGQAGGLIVAAGPVHAGKSINNWVQQPAMAPIRGLYPVEFERNLAMSEGGGYSAPEAWPLEFTREGLQADFLWLADEAAESQRTWAQLPGVYSFFPVRGLKPGAVALARFSDPRAARSGEAPVYFAQQFYGSGRVFYMGSPEMWRLRRIDDAAFERFYTKLIRHVSQGRLLRGSTRGVLLVGKDSGYLVGETVDIRAQVTNAQLEPLEAPSVVVHVAEPGGRTRTVTLRPEPSRPGTFAGGFTAAAEGTYRLDLAIPDAKDQQLSQRVQVRMPDLELENPQRNDPLLSRMAKATGGRYYVGTELALGDGPEGISASLRDRTRTIVLTAAPDPKWEETWLRWMMYALCGLLCVEWLIRRLFKLA